MLRRTPPGRLLEGGVDPRIISEGPLPSGRLSEGLRSRVGQTIVGGVGSFELYARYLWFSYPPSGREKHFVVAWVVGVGT